MTEKIEIRGYWHLPDKPEEKIAGILTYTPKVSIQLELIGSFNGDEGSVEAFLDKQEENIIHGISSDSKNITLINCFPSGSVNFSCPFPMINYMCQYLIIGKHISSLEDPSFWKAYVKIPILKYWCHPGALKKTINFNEKKTIEHITISFPTIPNDDRASINTTLIDKNTSLQLNKSIVYDQSLLFLKPKLEQYTSLVITKQENSSIKDFLTLIHTYEQFISLATLDAIECSEIILKDKELYQELEDGSRHYHNIELLYVQRTNRILNSKVKTYDFLFDFDAIKENYSNVIKKWFTVDENIIPIRRHLIESIKKRGVFSSIDFLIVVQALEGYCTRFRKEKIKEIKVLNPKYKVSLKDMLNILISEFICIDKVKDDSVCLEQVVDSRHYYSHFMEKSKKPNTLDGKELYDLTHKLRKLLICCILQFIGFEYKKINDIFNKSNSSILS